MLRVAKFPVSKAYTAMLAKAEAELAKKRADFEEEKRAHEDQMATEKAELEDKTLKLRTTLAQQEREARHRRPTPRRRLPPHGFEAQPCQQQSSSHTAAASTSGLDARDVE